MAASLRSVKAHLRWKTRQKQRQSGDRLEEGLHLQQSVHAVQLSVVYNEEGVLHTWTIRWQSPHHQPGGSYRKALRSQKAPLSAPPE